jgi:hypothetical protein
MVDSGVDESGSQGDAGGESSGHATEAIVRGSTTLDRQILVIRGRRVMLDRDLAALYRVHPKRLNQQVKRNRARFPPDFMFQLTPADVEILRLQSATSREGWGGRRYLPYAFTEHGAVMLASVLRSAVAIEASLHVVRAFVRLRALADLHAELAQTMEALEAKYDEQFRVVFEAIRQLMAPPTKPLGARIGFRTPDHD